MITIPPLPKYKDLIHLIKKSNNDIVLPWSNTNDSNFILSQSAVALSLIVDWYKIMFHIDKPVIWIPDYFCNETLMSIRNKDIEIFYYPVGKEFNPLWDKNKEFQDKIHPNIFVLVHYFGIENDINRARQFCNFNNCIFVEDAAHVLYPRGDIGKKSDFIFYSPHKLLAIPDGAILNANFSQNSSALKDIDKDKALGILKENVMRLSKKKNNYFWIIKRYMQKILPHKVVSNFDGMVKYGEKNIEPVLNTTISDISMKLLKQYDINKLKSISDRRRHNLEIMNYTLTKEFNNIKPINNRFTPYLSVYSLENVENKDTCIDRLIDKKYLMQFWPDLPFEIKKNPSEHIDATFMSSNYFTVPVHQTISTQTLIKRYLSNNSRDSVNLNIKIEWGVNDKKSWDSIYNSIEYSNITQSWEYGDAKQRVNGFNVNRGIIYKDDIAIGLIQVLEKKVLGITIITRINRGPLLIEKYKNIDLYSRVLDELNKHYCHGKHTIISISPEIDYSPEAIECLTRKKYKQIDKQNWSSSWINLTLDEEKLRKNLNSKWRNQLVSAEKRNLTFKEANGDFDYFMKLYKESMQHKKFVGVPVEILEDIQNNNEKSPLKIFTIADANGNVMAFDIVYVHGRCATYLVGWTDKNGKSANANNLLIYNIMLTLKNDGILKFDLGGIDDINTEDIARFKRGICGKEYELSGEFIHI